MAIVRHSSQQLLARTEPVHCANPIQMLRSVIASYVDYVAENRTTYVSLLRGSASGDPAMREVLEETRDVLATRALDQLPTIGLHRTPQVELAVRGWIAFTEEATISWLRKPAISRDELIALTVNALPALALAALGADAEPALKQ